MYVEKDIALGLGVESGVSAHGVYEEPPFVRAFKPVPYVSHTSVLICIARMGFAGAVQARLLSTGSDGSGLRSLPCLSRDMFAARRLHGGENINEVRVTKALHLDEVDDVLHVLTKLVTLMTLVGLVPGIRQEARGGRDGGN